MLVLVMMEQQYSGEMWMNSRKNNNREKHHSHSHLIVGFSILFPLVWRALTKVLFQHAG